MKVFAIAAITADGFIGRTAEHLADWTSSADKKLFVRLTKEAGVVVMGSKTFATIGRALPGRRTIVYTTNPRSIAVEGVEPTSEAPADLIARLEKEGAHSIAICGGATIYNMFIKAGIIDELYLTIEPVLFGKGISLFTDNLEVGLELLETEQLTKDAIMLHYAVVRS
jgi:dihydrofolate reductase